MSTGFKNLLLVALVIVIIVVVFRAFRGSGGAAYPYARFVIINPTLEDVIITFYTEKGGALFYEFYPGGGQVVEQKMNAGRHYYTIRDAHTNELLKDGYITIRGSVSENELRLQEMYINS